MNRLLATALPGLCLVLAATAEAARPNPAVLGAHPIPPAPHREALPAPCPWTVSGRIEVDHQLDELGVRSPLVGIEVRIKARRRVFGIWSAWSTWGTVRTDEDGDFTITRERSEDRRQFRIEVRFSSDDLQIRKRDATESLTKTTWHVVEERTPTRSPPTVSLGTLRFRAGGDHALGGIEARMQADSWCVATRVMDHLESLDSDLAFPARVKIEHRAFVSTPLGISHVNPYTQVAYIRDNEYSTRALVLGMMQIWAYQQGTQESALLEFLLLNGRVIGTSNRAVAFLVGFGDYAANEVMQGVFGSEPSLPFNRMLFRQSVPLADEAAMERNHLGWGHMLRLMSDPDLIRYDLNNTDSPFVRRLRFIPVPVGTVLDPPRLAFRHVLKAMRPHAATGTGAMRFREVSVVSFLARADRILRRLTADDAAALRLLFDPSRDEQPREVFAR